MNEKQLAIWAFAKSAEEAAKFGCLEDCRKYARMIQDILTDCIISNSKTECCESGTK
jgi:hypothetical protein